MRRGSGLRASRVMSRRPSGPNRRPRPDAGRRNDEHRPAEIRRHERGPAINHPGRPIMKIRSIVLATLLPAALIAGCETTPEHQKEEAGTVIGAVVGGLVGSQVGGGSGRVAGAVAGTIAGGFIGH